MPAVVDELGRVLVEAAQADAWCERALNEATADDGSSAVVATSIANVRVLLGHIAKAVARIRETKSGTDT